MFKLADPIPSAPMYHTGRGGAGNYRRLPTPLPAPTNSNALSQIPTNSSTRSNVFFSSRGGAGNVHPTSERAVFSFDEELAREQMIREHQPPVFSIGRGGSGNMVHSERAATRSFYSKKSGEIERTVSGQSGASGSRIERVRSGADKLWDRLKF